MSLTSVTLPRLHHRLEASLGLATFLERACLSVFLGALA